MTIHEKTETRWELAIGGDDADGAKRKVLFNSIDGDPSSAKVSVMGTASVVVSVKDLIDVLKRVAAHTNGIPRLE